MLHRIAPRASFFICLIICSPRLFAQSYQGDSLLPVASLDKVVQYAIKNQPLIQQSQLDEAITEQEIKSRLADWYPQINFAYNLQHNFQVPVAYIGGNYVKTGVNNTSNGQFTLRQNIFNPDVLLANRTRGDVRRQAKQTTTSNKIDIAAEVTKAFYSVLESIQEIQVAEGDIARLERSLQDAYNQYKSGVADKIDYKRTTIALNNTKANKVAYEASNKARVEYLKSLMNYPVTATLSLVYDSNALEQEVYLDTNIAPDYNNRIEYQLLETQRRLLRSNVDYNKWAYFPTLSANGAYNLNYNNNSFGKLYSNNFPSSYAALTLSLPIFQGGKRVARVRQAELQLKRTDWDMINLKNSVNAEYAQALAAYKSNYANYQALKENLALAQEVYDVIQLQYRSGIKAYLEVITSETDLRTARISYINALYQLLSAKVDVVKSQGLLNY